MEGTQQSGVMDLKLANLAQDGHILQLARQAAQSILDEDATLELDKHKVYKEYLINFNKNRPDWSRVG